MLKNNEYVQNVALSSKRKKLMRRKLGVNVAISWKRRNVKIVCAVITTHTSKMMRCRRKEKNLCVEISMLALEVVGIVVMRKLFA